MHITPNGFLVNIQFMGNAACAYMSVEPDDFHGFMKMRVNAKNICLHLIRK